MWRILRNTSMKRWVKIFNYSFLLFEMINFKNINFIYVLGWLKLKKLLHY